MYLSKIKNIVLCFPRPIKRMIAVSFDFLLCGFSTFLAFSVRFNKIVDFDYIFLIASLISLGISIPLFSYFGLYRAISRYMSSDSFGVIIRVFIIYSAIFFCIFTVIGFDGVPRSLGIIQPIFLFISFSSSRYLLRYWLTSTNIYVNNHFQYQAILIYGAGIVGRQLAKALAVNKAMKICGFIDDDAQLLGNTINKIPVYASKNLNELIVKLNVTDVFLAIPSVNQSRRNEIIESLSGCGVRVKTLPGLIDLASGRISKSDLYDLDINDLLGRETIPPKLDLLEENIKDKVIVVTGAGGSIGSELCRQIIKFTPRSLILIDNNEHSLYLIFEELKRIFFTTKDDFLHMQEGSPVYSSEISFSKKLLPYLASVRDKKLLLKIFKEHEPDIVFHAAAYKHVPLVEDNLNESIRNNVFGTLACAEVSLDCGVKNFVLISTDKAVRPTNIMGASKRIAELIVQGIADEAARSNRPSIFSMVRFGNVLGSSGSVILLFRNQIAQGGPITVTHPEVTRFFMTIPEAAQLVMQAGAMSTGGEVFVLDMGQPVRIYDLAVKMIYLSGNLIKNENNVHGNIEIKITGLRSGEKLYEELLISGNPEKTGHPKIMKASEEYLTWNNLQKSIHELNQALDMYDDKKIREWLLKLVPGYQPNIH